MTSTRAIALGATLAAALAAALLAAALLAWASAPPPCGFTDTDIGVHQCRPA